MKKDIVRYIRQNFPVPMSDGEVAQIVGSFMDSFDTCVAQLRAVSDGSDFPAIRRVTHTIKGFAATVGANDLAALANGLNEAARDADAAACAVIVGDILKLHSLYLAELPPFK